MFKPWSFTDNRITCGLAKNVIAILHHQVPKRIMIWCIFFVRAITDFIIIPGLVIHELHPERKREITQPASALECPFGFRIDCITFAVPVGNRKIVQSGKGKVSQNGFHQMADTGIGRIYLLYMPVLMHS